MRQPLILGVAIGFVIIGIGCYAQYLMRVPDATTWAGTLAVLAAAAVASRGLRATA